MGEAIQAFLGAVAGSALTLVLFRWLDRRKHEPIVQVYGQAPDSRVFERQTKSRVIRDAEYRDKEDGANAA
jgi:hypothetical protein